MNERHEESSVRTRELGRRLSAAQRGAGFNGSQLAALMEWPPPLLSKTMRGRRRPSEVEAAVLLAYCGINHGTERDRTLALCHPHQDGSVRLPVDDAWSTYLVHAGEAAGVLEYDPLIVPWPVQTPDYTNALLNGVADQVTASARVTARRAALSLLQTPSLTLLVHEWALRSPVGDSAMMSDQLHHLLRMSVRPRVCLRVVPAERHSFASGHGGFTMLEYSDHRPVVYLEDHATGALIDHRPDVAIYRSVAKALDAAALDESQSRDLISHIAVDLYGGDKDQQHTRSEIA